MPDLELEDIRACLEYAACYIDHPRLVATACRFDWTQNLEPELAAWLGSRYKLVVRHVRELALQCSTDSELFDAARRLNATLIVTKDSDFIDLVTLRGPPPQILRLTCGNRSSPEMHVILARTFSDALKMIESGASWVEIS